MKCFGFIFLFLLPISQIEATNFELLKCDKYTINDGLPQSFVQEFFQDNKGYLWISTQDGVSRFNGYKFENFYSDPFDSTSILSNYIIGIDNWNEDSICFTTRTGFSIFDPISLKFKNFPFALNNDKIGSISSSLKINKDSLIISSSKGLFGIKISKGKTYVNNLNFQRAVSKIVSFNKRTFFSSDSVLFERVKDINKPVKNYKKRILTLTSNRGGLGISLLDEFILFKSNTAETDTLLIPYRVNDYLFLNGEYWLATDKNGLVTIKSDNKTSRNNYQNKKRNNSLLSHKINSIYRDCFGIVWIGTDNGINKIDLSKQKLLQYRASQHNPESSNNTWSFWENDSLLVTGYDNGLQIFKKDNGARLWVPFDGLVLDIIDFSDTILLATSKGLHFLDSQDSSYKIKSVFFKHTNKEKEDIIFRFFKVKDLLFVGSLNHLSVFDNTFSIKKRWKFNNVRDFTRIDNSIYFTAFPTGIYQLNNLDDENKWQIERTPLKEIEHLLSLSIGKSQKTSIWIGLYGGGLIEFNLKDKSTKHYSTKNGLPNNTIYSIVPLENEIWFSTNTGLSKYNVKSRDFENYSTADGTQSLEFNSGAAYINNKNQIYFGGINGYNIINTGKKNINKTPPKVYITSIIYGKEDLLKSDSKNMTFENNSKIVTIPHKKNKFEIIVDGLHYSSPNENIFKTKLDGWENEWKTFKGKRSFKFSNLHDGEYVFLVKSANSDGVWNKEVEKIKIIIKPPFYLTWWFILGLSVFILSLTAFGIKSRVNRSRSQRQILEKKVRDRTREVENQKKKLEEKNKELEEEKNKEEEVLLNMLPRETAKELVSTGKSTPKSYKMATVMFADFKNFTKITENLGPKELVAELDDSFAKFDDFVGKLNIEKIKTSGDAYMCVGGIPIRNQTNPIDCVLAAFQFQKYMQQKRDIREGTGKPQWHLRIGLHTGALVAGVVGKRKFLYDVWGDTVNTAARMETSAEEGMINVSGATHEYIKDYFECEYRGKLPVKNKGAIDMYYVKKIKEGLHKNEDEQTPNRKFFELLNFKVYTQQSFQNVRDYFIDLLEQNEFISKLKYHGPHHTIDVMKSAERIGLAEGISKEDLMLVKLAALFHDSGFLNKYENNEFEGAKLAKRELPRYGFTERQVDKVVNMILATKIPQDPKNHLEEILCDADLDYLGRDKEEFDRISSSLAQELIDMEVLKSFDSWDPIQIKFLESHQYYTKTCIKDRRPNKIERLREIKDRLQGPN